MTNAYLINATKKEYVIFTNYPEGVGTNLLILEKVRSWNLHRDDIIVGHASTVYTYKNVSEFIYKVTSKGGEIIHENLKLY